MKCQHCKAEVKLEAKGWPAVCPSCGQPLTPPSSKLMVYPKNKPPTLTERLLEVLGILCEIAGMILTGLGFFKLQLLAIGVACIINGLILLALGHALRYLRLMVNSLTKFRARPLGTQVE